MADGYGFPFYFGFSDKPLYLSPDGDEVRVVIEENIPSGAGQAHFAGQSVSHALLAGVAVEKEETSSLQFGQNHLHLTGLLREARPHVIVNARDVWAGVESRLCHLKDFLLRHGDKERSLAGVYCGIFLRLHG